MSHEVTDHQDMFEGVWGGGASGACVSVDGGEKARPRYTDSGLSSQAETAAITRLVITQGSQTQWEFYPTKWSVSVCPLDMFVDFH